MPVLDPVIRLPLTLPLVVFLPGYALVRAAMPATRLSFVDSLVLGLGTSLSIAALGGILLNVTPTGIRTDTWVALLFAVTIASTLIFTIRTARTRAPSPRVTSWVPELRRRWSINPTLVLQAVFFGFALLIVVAAFALATAGVDSQPRPGFAQLWLMPTDDPARVSIGIRNEEHRTIQVQLQLTRGSSIEADWPSITLEDGQTWETTATVTDLAPGNVPLRAELRHLESPDIVYRYVTLWP